MSGNVPTDADSTFVSRTTCAVLTYVGVLGLLLVVTSTTVLPHSQAFVWAAFNAHWQARVLRGHGASERSATPLPHLVICTLIILMLSLISIPLHLLAPTTFPEWYVGPAMTAIVWPMFAVMDAIAGPVMRRAYPSNAAS